MVSFTQESQRYSESYMRKTIKKIVDSLDDRILHDMYINGNYSSIIEEFLKKSVAIGNDSSSRLGCVCINDDYCKILVNAVKEAFVIPETISRMDNICLARDLLLSIKRYYQLLEKGVRYEDARFIIPQAVKTRLLATMNLRELLHIACLRLSPKAQWEIREVVSKMIEEASRVIPEIYDLVEGYCKKYDVK